MKPAEYLRGLFKESDVTVDAKLDNRIINDAFSALERPELTRTTAQYSLCRIIMKSRIVRLAAGIVIVVALLGIRILTYSDTEVGSERIVAAGNLHAEIISIRQMAAARDVVGLASMLSQGRFESKLVAANFLTNMGSLPALEALSMHASGDLILEVKAGKLVLGSAGSADWLEVSGKTLLLHTGKTVQPAAKVRIAHDVRGDSEDWEKRQREFRPLRQERADLERELSELRQSPPKDIDQLRKRLAHCNEMLDHIDGAVYVRIENGRLKLHCPTYHATALAELANGILRVQSDGHIVEANSVTLLHELRPVLTDGPPLPTLGWRERFDKVYSLDEGEVLRRVRTPFIPERQIYATQELHYYSSTDNPPPPGYLFFRLNGKLYNWTLAMHECNLALVLHSMGLKRYEYSDRSEKLVRLKLGGDWIERKSAPMEDKLSALEKILEDELGRKIRFEKRRVNRGNGIIVRGQYKRVPLEGVDRPENIYLYTDLHKDFRGPEPIAGGGTGSIAEMIEWVGSYFNRPVVIETEDLPDITVSWHDSESLSFATADAKTKEEKQAILDSALQNLSRQTSLQFEYGQCEQDVWFITEQSKAE